MSAIKVKVCSGTRILYTTEVLVKLEEPVEVLKKKICEKLSRLSDQQEPRVEAVYMGRIMQDCNPLLKYGVMKGNTIYIYKKIQTEITSDTKQLTKTDWDNLTFAVSSFKKNPVFKKSMMNHTSPDEIFNIILNVSDLNEDLVSIARLPLSELLDKLMDTNVLLRLAQQHPPLASNILHLADAAVKGLLHSEQQEELFKDFMQDSIIDIEDLSTSETSNPPVYENSSSETTTVAQLSSALGRISIQQPQPNTSDATVHQMNDEELSTSLQMMKEMGLSDEKLNHYTLLETNDLGISVELILNGFEIGDTYRNSR